jgi:rRNA-processing protein FCF1
MFILLLDTNAALALYSKGINMIHKKKSSFFFVVALLLSGCVSPEIVQTSSVNDSGLSCEQIKVQLTQLEEIRSEASKGKSVSGENVAAAILFWPAVIGNYNNAQQAVEAANKRNEVLVAIANKKRCKF